MPSFAGHLQSLLKVRGLSGRAFALLVGANQSYVSKVLRGTRPAPDTDLERWAHALQLTQREQRRFLLLADLDHVPERLRPLLGYLLRQPKGRLRLSESRPNDMEDLGDLAWRATEELDGLLSTSYRTRRSKPHQ